MKRNDGFTLVELLVTIAASSIVLAAAASLLLLGVRIQKAVQEEAGEQQTIRIVLNMLEDLSASGKISSINQLDENSWAIYSQNDSILLQYHADDHTLRTGDPTGTILVDKLKNANVQLTGSLLTFTFDTKDHNYSTSIYCRTQVDVDVNTGKEIVEDLNSMDEGENISSVTFPDVSILSPEEKAARYAFLQTLASQYGSTGKIKGSDIYFSEWYIGGYGEDHPGWNADTPWCACFLSWAAARQPTGALINAAPQFADVDNGMAYFTDPEKPGGWRNGGDRPIPGDYIFFDWSGGNDPDHVGAVLCVRGNLVYTIEGNSGGKVNVHSYSLNDSRIVGYGVLDWNKGTETTE